LELQLEWAEKSRKGRKKGGIDRNKGKEDKMRKGRTNLGLSFDCPISMEV
jgi:hypothetical protein